MMKYKVCKLSFSGKLHLGTGMLDSTASAFYADTLFSALCCEIVQSKDLSALTQLVEWCRSRKLILSDAMPFSEDTLFLPKPFLSVHGDNEKEGDSKRKKLFKKLRYIPAEELGAFSAGTMEPESAAEKLAHIGRSSIRTLAHVSGEEDSVPYQVGEYQFYKGCGLYFIAACADAAVTDFLTKLMTSLSFTGIGGKRTAGLGKFTFSITDANQGLTNALEQGAKAAQKMTLSVSLPKDHEMKSAIGGASYSLIRRSGFVASYTYAKTYRKKNDLYVFQAGSCFENAFCGDVYDVSSGGAHPVYRYAVPMFIAVR